MHLRWEGDTPLADADMLAAIYGVSTRTVRRYCTPARRLPPAGPGTVQALYDVFAVADNERFAAVAPRPERTAARIRAALAHRKEQARIRAARGR